MSNFEISHSPPVGEIMIFQPIILQFTLTFVTQYFEKLMIILDVNVKMSFFRECISALPALEAFFKLYIKYPRMFEIDVFLQA